MHATQALLQRSQYYRKVNVSLVGFFSSTYFFFIYFIIVLHRNVFLAGIIHRVYVYVLRYEYVTRTSNLNFFEQFFTSISSFGGKKRALNCIFLLAESSEYSEVRFLFFELEFFSHNEGIFRCAVFSSSFYSNVI